jgi:hypothetical protein
VEHARVQVRVSSAGEVTELGRMLVPIGDSKVCIGRRPAGWVDQPAAAGTSILGAHFAAIAQLEAASVTAFEILAGELLALAAPRPLIAAVRAAAQDEVRHAERTTELAQRFGAEVSPPQIEPRAPRQLLALAIDNAVEGCVRETFGAAVGCYQALAAQDPEIARVMCGIAADETRHAALALRLEAWLLPRLCDAERAQVEHARRAAIAELARSLEQEPLAALNELAGVPDAARARQLHSVLARELWAAA